MAAWALWWVSWRMGNFCPIPRCLLIRKYGRTVFWSSWWARALIPFHPISQVRILYSVLRPQQMLKSWTKWCWQTARCPFLWQQSFTLLVRAFMFSTVKTLRWLRPLSRTRFLAHLSRISCLWALRAFCWRLSTRLLSQPCPQDWTLWRQAGPLISRPWWAKRRWALKIRPGLPSLLPLE